MDQLVRQTALATSRHSPSAEVSLANLLWAAALAQLSPADVQQLLQGHDQTLREAKRVELVRLLWALGKEEREEWDEMETCGVSDIAFLCI
jgi:hypothetical protein